MDENEIVIVESSLKFFKLFWQIESSRENPQESGRWCWKLPAPGNMVSLFSFLQILSSPTLHVSVIKVNSSKSPGSAVMILWFLEPPGGT